MPSNENKRILIADDDDAFRESARAMLEAIEFRVTTVSTGSAAVEKCRRSSFDVVLMDVDMADMSGDEACRQITSEGICRCVILMSGRPQPDGLIQASGAFGFVAKPFRVDELLAHIDHCTKNAA